MPRGKRAKPKGGEHSFGGDWTEKKLGVLADYLRAYGKVLKYQPFHTTYIDAFAGTGYRSLAGATSSDLLFPDLAADAPQGLLDGSARLALKTSPRFNDYVFIERDAARCVELENLRKAFPELASDIRIDRGDANDRIRTLCKETDWRLRRAVLFLDPYGMQVEWQTITAVAATKAIDLWLLFPLGIGVNRLLTRSGDIPQAWRAALDRLLGTSDWFDEFYQVQPDPQGSLFGSPRARVEKATMETIGRYFNRRLKSVFADVADPPGILRNSVQNPLYLFCFASGNKAGARRAVPIANHLLERIH